MNILIIINSVSVFNYTTTVILTLTGAHCRSAAGPGRPRLHVQQTSSADVAVDEVGGASRERHALPWRHRERRTDPVRVGVLLQGHPARHTRGGFTYNK